VDTRGRRNRKGERGRPSCKNPLRGEIFPDYQLEGNRRLLKEKSQKKSKK